jgi:hypothetical protein
MLFFMILPKYLYLKINSYYKVLIYILVEARNHLDNLLIVWAKYQGGIREFREYIQCYDLIRERKKLCRIMEKRI